MVIPSSSSSETFWGAGSMFWLWRLNAATQFDRYPIPHIQDFFAELEKAKIFSTIEFNPRISPGAGSQSRHLQSSCYSSLWNFWASTHALRLKNAAQAFQRLMDSVCHSLDHVFCIWMTFLLRAPTPQKHQQHLRQIFERQTGPRPCRQCAQLLVRTNPFTFSQPPCW